MPAKKLITREMILNAALKLLRERGFEAVNIKELAKELKCSTQPVYLSFTGMDELREELIPLAVKEFEEIMRNDSEKNEIRLYDMEYIHFAKREPKLFCFLFMRANAFAEIKRRLLPIIEQSVTEFMEIYQISHEQADDLHDHLWMHAHGIASMIATDFCDWDLEKVHRMIEECKTAFAGQYGVTKIEV
ncbi:TetR/AcrR family transcriptional regulator [Brotaphodocola sp.]|uniref:TetR/AcrR family transcriptional regulator n=1 Tax=Brotaphodocola sp. TaxID=3073577 RepID=UPI003D7D4154